MKTNYPMLRQQAAAFLEEEPHYVAAMSNISALLMEHLEDLNWAGFYIMREGRLVVGPFQGKTACIHIAMGHGVCGNAAEQNRTLVVPDVHEFPGHIACDSASNSEIVIPLHRGETVAGVLDIDSPAYNRFTEEDRLGLEAIVRDIEKGITW